MPIYCWTAGLSSDLPHLLRTVVLRDRQAQASGYTAVRTCTTYSWPQAGPRRGRPNQERNERATQPRDLEFVVADSLPHRGKGGKVTFKLRTSVIRQRGNTCMDIRFISLQHGIRIFWWDHRMQQRYFAGCTFWLYDMLEHTPPDQTAASHSVTARPITLGESSWIDRQTWITTWHQQPETPAIYRQQYSQACAFNTQCFAPGITY